MSNRSRREAEARAEARRRARRQAQGFDPVDEDDGPEPDEPATGSPAGGFSGGMAGGMLGRLFPPAPPLPNRPDPLAGFTYDGPLRGAVSGLYLLARNPVAWIAPGALWAVGRLLTTNSLVGIFASLISFAALIGAGWLGWQRPWLFGLLAALVGMLVFAGIGTALLSGNPEVEFTVSQLFLGLLFQESFQPLFGALAGWYGGYLRRRLAVTAPPPQRSSRRR